MIQPDEWTTNTPGRDRHFVRGGGPYNPINRFGVSKTVAGAQVYGDGLIRASFAGFKR